MRIISGTAKGTKLNTLEGLETRPTLDRVKESLFSIIQLKIPDSNVLDLFAGSGALGIEALSRGASKAVFCDSNYSAIKIVNQNLEKTKLLNKAKVLNTNYNSALESLSNEKFDIVFLDPPYKTNFVEKSIEKILKLDLLSEQRNYSCRNR
jgi:16S rRNA (guanine966-N2)-methyltransferase